MSTFRAKQIISRCPNLPTIPAVVTKIGELMKDPACGPREIGALVAQDPPLAARVLKIANSSYYGLRERCASTEQACTVLGLKVLRNVVMTAAVTENFSHLDGRGLDLEEMWKHSVLVAQAAQLLARVSRGGVALSPDEFYSCGLLHDIGKLVLLENLGDDYRAVLQRAHREGRPVQNCERERLLFDHTDVGSMIAIHWGLPTAIAAAIQYHHGPREAVEQDPVVSLVANANLLVQRVQAGNLTAAASTFDADTARFLAIARDDVAGVVLAIAEHAAAAAA
jgi:putative nucleotidyltransferase with HDIG domain